MRIKQILIFLFFIALNSGIVYSVPQFSNNNTYPLNPTTYLPSQNYRFNITIEVPETLDNSTSESNITIEHNFTGTKTNYTVFDHRDLIVHLSMDEGSGTTAYDGSYNNPTNGSIVSGTWKNAFYKKGIEFDGSSTRIWVSYDSKMNITTPFTFSIMYFPYELALDDLVTRYQAVGSNRYWVGGINSDGNMTWHLQNNTNEANTGTSQIQIPVYRWSNLVWRFNGSHIQCFVNGIRDSYAGEFYGIPNPSSTRQIVLGARESGSLHPYGIIDEFRVYNRSLSDSEIEKLYDISKKEYIYEYSDLSSGYYDLKIYADGTDSSTNTTEFQYNVNKNSNPITFNVNNTGTNRNIPNNSVANFTVEFPSQLKVNMTSNMTGWVEIEEDDGYLENITLFQSNGVYNFTSFTNGNENYTQQSIERAVQVNEYSRQSLVKTMDDYIEGSLIKQCLDSSSWNYGIFNSCKSGAWIKYEARRNEVYPLIMAYLYNEPTSLFYQNNEIKERVQLSLLGLKGIQNIQGGFPISTIWNSVSSPHTYFTIVDNIPAFLLINSTLTDENRTLIEDMFIRSAEYTVLSNSTNYGNRTIGGVPTPDPYDIYDRSVRVEFTVPKTVTGNSTRVFIGFRTGNVSADYDINSVILRGYLGNKTVNSTYFLNSSYLNSNKFFEGVWGINFVVNTSDIPLFSMDDGNNYVFNFTLSRPDGNGKNQYWNSTNNWHIKHIAGSGGNDWYSTDNELTWVEYSGEDFSAYVHPYDVNNWEDLIGYLGGFGNQEAGKMIASFMGYYLLNGTGDIREEAFKNFYETLQNDIISTSGNGLGCEWNIPVKNSIGNDIVGRGHKQYCGISDNYSPLTNYILYRIYELTGNATIYDYLNKSIESYAYILHAQNLTFSRTIRSRSSYYQHWLLSDEGKSYGRRTSITAFIGMFQGNNTYADQLGSYINRSWTSSDIIENFSIYDEWSGVNQYQFDLGSFTLAHKYFPQDTTDELPPTLGDNTYLHDLNETGMISVKTNNYMCWLGYHNNTPSGVIGECFRNQTQGYFVDVVGGGDDLQQGLGVLNKYYGSDVCSNVWDTRTSLTKNSDSYPYNITFSGTMRFVNQTSCPVSYNTTFYFDDTGITVDWEANDTVLINNTVVNTSEIGSGSFDGGYYMFNIFDGNTIIFKNSTSMQTNYTDTSESGSRYVFDVVQFKGMGGKYKISPFEWSFLSLTEGSETKLWDASGNLIDDEIPVMISGISNSSGVTFGQILYNITINSSQNYDDVDFTVDLPSIVRPDSRYLLWYWKPHGENATPVNPSNVDFTDHLIINLEDIDINQATGSNELYSEEYTVILDNCSTYNTTFITMYLLEEINQTLMNGTIEANFEVLNTESQQTGNFSFKMQGDSEYNLCMYPSNATFMTNAFIQYYSSGYPYRWYFLRNATLSNDTTTLNLYLLEDNLADPIILNVVDNVGNAESDVYIKAQRYYPESNTYKTIAMGKTDFDGSAVMQLRKNDAWYKFIFERDGQVIKSTGATIITGDTLEVSISSIIFGEYWSFYDTLAYSCSYNNITWDLTCTYSDTSNLAEKVCLTVDRIGSLNSTKNVCNSCEYSASGTLICNNLDNSTTYKYTLWGYFDVEHPLTIGWLSPAKIIQYGTEALLLSGVVFIALAMTGVWNPSVSIFMGIVGIIAGYSLNWITISYASMLGLLVALAVVIKKLRT